MKFFLFLLLLLPLYSSAQDKVLMREGYFIEGLIDSFAQKSLFIVQEVNGERRELPSIMINKVFINGGEEGLVFMEARLVFVKPIIEENTLVMGSDSLKAVNPNHLLMAGENMLSGFEKLADITVVTLVAGVSYAVLSTASGTENIQYGVVVGAITLNTGLFIASINNFIRASKHFISAVQASE